MRALVAIISSASLAQALFCNPGKYCLPSDTGEGVAPVAGTCETCAQGHYRSGGSEVCPSRRRRAKQSTTCTACPAGKTTRTPAGISTDFMKVDKVSDCSIVVNSPAPTPYAFTWPMAAQPACVAPFSTSSPFLANTEWKECVATAGSYTVGSGPYACCAQLAYCHACNMAVAALASMSGFGCVYGTASPTPSPTSAPTAAPTPAPLWTGTVPAYTYTDAQCTSGKGAAPASTSTKSVRTSATTACISVTAGSTNQFFRQTCATGATSYTQQSCDSADCSTCTGSALTYTIETTAAGYCVSRGGNHYMADNNVVTTTAGDPNSAAAPCFQTPTMSPTPSPNPNDLALIAVYNLVGFNISSFDAAAQQALLDALSSILVDPVGLLQIMSVLPVGARRRLGVSEAGSSPRQVIEAKVAAFFPTASAQADAKAVLLNGTKVAAALHASPVTALAVSEIKGSVAVQASTRAAVQKQIAALKAPPTPAPSAGSGPPVGIIGGAAGAVAVLAALVVIKRQGATGRSASGATATADEKAPAVEMTGAPAAVATDATAI